MSQHTSEPTLREYFSMLYRRKLILLTVFVITTGGVVAGAYLTPPVFTASTTLLVKFGREFFYRHEVGDLASSKAFSLEQMVNSEVEILSSRDLAQQVVEEVGVDALYPDLYEDGLEEEVVLAKAVAMFQSGVAITDVFDSGIITIAFEHRDPKIAAGALKILVERFKDKHLEIFGESKSSFLQKQLEKYRETLDRAETALQDFRHENGVYDLPGQKNATLAQRVELQAELRAARFRISELEQQLQAFDKSTSEVTAIAPNSAFSRQKVELISRRNELNSLLQDGSSRIAELTQSLREFTRSKRKTDEAVPPRPGVERFRSLDEGRIRLLDLELKYVETRRNYKKDSREVVSLRKAILRVKKFLKERGEYVGKVFETAIRDERSSLQARRKTLTEQVSQTDSDIESLVLLERSRQMQTISGQLAALRIKEDSLVAELAKLADDLRDLGAKAKALRRLERDVTIGERSFQTSLEKFDEAKTTAELDEQKVVSIRVIETAALPVAPTGLPKTMKIALGAVTGLLAGVAAAFFLELLAR